MVKGRITTEDDGTSNPCEVTFGNGEVSRWLYVIWATWLTKTMAHIVKRRRGVARSGSNVWSRRLARRVKKSKKLMYRNRRAN